MRFEEIVDLVSNFVFGLICHQNSFILMEVAGKDLMLCPRCSGLHTGFFFIFLLTFIRYKGRFTLTGLFSKIYCIAAIVILFFEWFLAQKGIIHSSTESRYITGLLAGSGFGLLVMVYRNYVFNRNNIPNHSQFTVLLILTLLLGLGLFQLKNWYILTLSLFLMVVINFAFIMHTIIFRVYSVYSNNHKTLFP